MFPPTPRLEFSTQMPVVDGIPLEIVVIYDDRESFRTAMLVFGETIRDLENASDVCLLPWRFAEIRSDPWRDRALADAADADIIVLSVAADRPLPGDMLAWLGDALDRRYKREGKIVMLRGHDLDGPYFETACADVARRVAGFSGLALAAAG